MLWRKHLKVNIRQVHEQFIHCLINNPSFNFTVSVTIVYARNKKQQSDTLWQELKVVSANLQIPWILSGDFNNVLSTEGRMDHPVTPFETQGLQDMLDILQLTPLKSKGCFCT